jgi:HEAT repeat protein
MVLEFPSLANLSWVKIRAIGKELAASQPLDDVVEAASAELTTEDHRRRMLATYLLGFTAGERPANLERLRQVVPEDPSWEVQEVLAQAFDASCSAIGYESALPTIDSWLADSRPNARRAVSEGLRPWTSKSRPYFARNPREAIRRLAALRADPSEYVRHSAGNALRDVRRAFPALVDAETATWDLGDPRIAFTCARVERAR